LTENQWTEDAPKAELPRAGSADGGGAALANSTATAPRGGSSRNRISTFVLVALVAILAAVLLTWFLSPSRFRDGMPGPGDAVVLLQFENKTGDRSLDNSVEEALRIQLAQSSFFRFPGEQSYRAARRQLAGLPTDPDFNSSAGVDRRVAERLGAHAYVTGSITESNGAYSLHLDLRDTASNKLLATLDERADSLQQVPNAVDGIAFDLRSTLGETRASLDQSSVPLVREASVNFAAIQLYAQAEQSVSSNEPLAALAELRQAVSLDAKFVQAQLLLAEVYAELRAETSASDAAAAALAAAASGPDERTQAIAQAAYETLATGDLPRATSLLRHAVSLAPHDADALAQLATVMRLQGHFGESLQVAQQGIAEDPFNEHAYSEAVLAMIALDRFDAAFQLEHQAQRLGISRTGDLLTAAYLNGRQEIVDSLVGDLPAGPMEYRPDWNFGIYFDNAGRLAAGSALWRSRAETASQTASLRSASSFLLAQGALDRALLGECSDALDLLGNSGPGVAEPRGRVALFYAGVVTGLCGESESAMKIVLELQDRFPRSTDVAGFYVADIQAAVAIAHRNPATAIQALQSSHGFDSISLTPFLLGRANLDLHQPAIGIVDYQTQLSRRGVAFVVGNDLYSASELELARAFAQSGDLPNSVEAYRKFLDLWRSADVGNPLRLEANLHSVP
jgi:tetratricopeptide (TPR) repeat protein